MTDNEIVKALECCRCESALCAQCPLKDVGHTCEDKLTGYAFDLVNRQKLALKHDKMVIKDLENIVENLKTVEYPYTVKCNDNAIICTKALADYDALIADIKQEAIIDFSKAIADKIDDGIISTVADLADFTAEYLKSGVKMTSQ